MKVFTDIFCGMGPKFTSHGSLEISLLAKTEAGGLNSQTSWVDKTRIYRWTRN